MDTLTGTVELPLWGALLLVAFCLGAGWLRGFAAGRGIKL